MRILLRRRIILQAISIAKLLMVFNQLIIRMKNERVYCPRIKADEMPEPPERPKEQEVEVFEVRCNGKIRHRDLQERLARLAQNKRQKGFQLCDPLAALQYAKAFLMENDESFTTVFTDKDQDVVRLELGLDRDDGLYQVANVVTPETVYSKGTVFLCFAKP